jgi:hypothetical protein
MYHGATGLAGPRTLITSRSERPNLPALRPGRLTLPISGPLRGGLVARPVQAGPEGWARRLRQGG